MFGFEKEYKRIQVSFFELKAASPFAIAELPIEQLPDTFEIDTTLHLGNDDWVVQQATPRTKAEFRKTGKVSIQLYKPHTASVPLSEILYSLPTISNDFPTLVDAPSLTNVFVAHEDDWRQFEIVSAGNRGIVEREFASIRSVLDTQRVRAGFKSTHLRKLLPTPLTPGDLLLSELKKTAGASHEYAGVAFSSKAAVVVGGFAFCASDRSIFWGQATPSGYVIALCIRSRPEATAVESEPLRKLLTRNRLLFVDWLSLTVSPEPTA